MKFFNIHLMFVILFSFIFSTYQMSYADKLPIQVSATAQDRVGNKLVYQIREQIRRSASFILTSTDEPRLKLSIVTIDPFKEQMGGYATVYSVTFKISGVLGFGLGDYFVGNLVGICGGNAVQSSAELILAEADNYSQIVKTSISLGKSIESGYRLIASERQQLRQQIEHLNQEIEKLKSEIALEKAKTWWDKLWGN